MPDPIVVLQRRVPDAEALTKTLNGTPVPAPPRSTVLPSPDPGHPGTVVEVRDQDTKETIAFITRMTDDVTAQLRWAVQSVQMGGVARMATSSVEKGQAGTGRTFGYAPKRVAASRESCRVALAAEEHPKQHRVLTDLAGRLTREFADLLPGQAAADTQIVDAVLPDWRLDENALWTSGVINSSAALPYHYDGANFHTWSAMPTLRYGTAGGQLHIPAYDMTFPCADGEVTWFCGRDLLHGVTPMRTVKPNGYRFSVVYYALMGMLNCADYATENAKAAVARTTRERKIAAEAEAGLPRDHNWPDPDKVSDKFRAGRPTTR